MTTSAVPARRQDAAARAERAAELRVGGATWASIAAEVGFTEGSNARRAVLAHFGSVPAPDREAARELWRQRTEWLWAEAVADVQARRPGALRAAVALAQRASQLDGLDAPTTMAVYSPDATEYNAVLSRMIELDRQARGVQLPAPEADIFSDEFLHFEAEVVGVEPAAPSVAP